MHLKLGTLVAALVFATPPAIAQDLPTDQLDRHADTVRQRMLVQSTVGRSVARRNGGGATANQAAACAKKAQFRSQYGAGHPKVQQLYSLCRSVGL